MATGGLARESRRLSSGASKSQWPGTQRGQRIPKVIVSAKEKEKENDANEMAFLQDLPPNPSLPCRELCCHMVPSPPLSKDVLTLLSPLAWSQGPSGPCSMGTGNPRGQYQPRLPCRGAEEAGSVEKGSEWKKPWRQAKVQS